jgi:Ca-activated chloride channel family protein
MIRPVLDPAVLLVLTLTMLAVVVAGAAWTPRKERLGWLVRGLMVLVLAAAALRPGLGTAHAETQPADLEVVLVVDRTTSMSALDWNGAQSRLTGVGRDVADLVAALPAARFAVVSFGKHARVELPSTSDVTLVEETVSSIEREEVLAGRGSSIDRPLDLLVRLLGDTAQLHPERRRVVVLMTDGENTAHRRQRTFTSLEPLLDGGLVLGYGSSRGGPMLVDERHPREGFVEDPATGTTAISRLDEANLRQVSDELGAAYEQRAAPGGLQEVAASWRREFVEEVDGHGGEVPADLELGWVLGIALLLLALVELAAHWRRCVQARRALR